MATYISNMFSSQEAASALMRQYKARIEAAQGTLSISIEQEEDVTVETKHATLTEGGEDIKITKKERETDDTQGPVLVVTLPDEADIEALFADATDLTFQKIS